jgi:hypothetical protein
MVDIPSRDIAHTPEHLNSRVHYDRENLAELVESIREHGVIQLIVVEPCPHAEVAEWAITVGDQDWIPTYMLVAGNDGAVESARCTEVDVFHCRLLAPRGNRAFPRSSGYMADAPGGGQIGCVVDYELSLEGI